MKSNERSFLAMSHRMQVISIGASSIGTISHPVDRGQVRGSIAVDGRFNLGTTVDNGTSLGPMRQVGNQYPPRIRSNHLWKTGGKQSE